MHLAQVMVTKGKSGLQRTAGNQSRVFKQVSAYKGTQVFSEYFFWNI